MGIRNIPGGAAVKRLVINYAAMLPGYAPSNLPGDGEGQLAYDNQRKSPAWYDGTRHEWPTFVNNQGVETGTTTVSNTTDETEIARFTIDPGAMVESRLFIIRVFGKYSTASSNDDFTYRVKFGDEDFDPTAAGTTIASITTIQENVTDGPWQLKTTMTVFSEGESGTLGTHNEGAFNNTKKDDHVDPSDIDTTTARDVAVTVQWNNAKAGNSVTRGQGYLQKQA